MAMIFKNILFNIFIFILLSCTIIRTEKEEDECIKSTPCLCKLKNDRFIDITHIVKNDKPFLRTDRDNLTYFFYPCQDVKFNASSFNLNVTPVNNNCSSGTSLCLYNELGQSLTNLGTTKNQSFSKTYPKSLIFNVTNDISACIELVCTPESQDTYFILKDHKKHFHQLVLVSPYACTHTEIHSLSIGSTLLILSTTAFGIYFLGGALLLHLIRGARGKEMIPNLGFWTDLPFLVKDGIIFLLSGCNSTLISPVETYDRI